MGAGRDRADQPAALLGAQRRVYCFLRSGRNGTAPPPGPGPGGSPPDRRVRSRNCPFASRPARCEPTRPTSAAHSPPAQSQLVLLPGPHPGSRSGPLGPSSRPPETTAASRHGEHEPPNCRAAARANAPTSSTTAATGSVVGAEFVPPAPTTEPV